jgi:excisionase family DNA binding protein
MSDPKKIIPLKSEPSPPAGDERMIVLMTKAELRELIRDEIGKANGNGCNPPALLSADQAAKLLDVPKTWISEAARRGELPSVRLGHYVRFRIEDLQAFVATRNQRKL